MSGNVDADTQTDTQVAASIVPLISKHAPPVLLPGGIGHFVTIHRVNRYTLGVRIQGLIATCGRGERTIRRN